jgi:hypothetical protein
MSNIDLPGDSGDYQLLTQGVQLSSAVAGITCEIGLRRGGGSKHIIDAISQHCPHKVHIAIDPYGHIPYEHKEGQVVQLDYTNEMYSDCMTNVHEYAKQKKVLFYFYPLEDTEFFSRFPDGVPVYQFNKRIEKKYSFVHFDGPHAVEPLMEEMLFFLYRINEGACWCFDDVNGYYDHAFCRGFLV